MHSIKGGMTNCQAEMKKMGYNKRMGLRALLRREKNEIYAPVAQLDRARASLKIRSNPGAL